MLQNAGNEAAFRALQAAQPWACVLCKCCVRLTGEVMQADYSPDCVQQLSNQQQRRIKDWRLDYELRQACKADVATVRPPAWLSAEPAQLAFVHSARQQGRQGLTTVCITLAAFLLLDPLP